MTVYPLGDVPVHPEIARLVTNIAQSQGKSRKVIYTPIITKALAAWYDLGKVSERVEKMILMCPDDQEAVTQGFIGPPSRVYHGGAHGDYDWTADEALG